VQDTNETGHATDARLILLSPEDNCLVAAARLDKGETLLIDGERVTLAQTVELAHKIARRALLSQEKVRRYGAVIGHVTRDVGKGEHLHTHNLESDYLPTYTHDAGREYVHH
jgi:hypothetical protein